MAVFQKATKKKSRLRLALDGPSGSGKTYSALAIASHLGGRVAVIDTERGSASKYSHLFDFDVVELDQYDPRNYIDMIAAAEAEGYAVLIVDSLTHAWSGRGGALELVDNAARRSQSKNTYFAWRDVTPLHNALVDAMLGSACHLIATIRTKTDYVIETDPRTGKQAPRKVGLAPIQRDGMEYEFDVVLDLTLDHDGLVGKTRCDLLDGRVFHKPGKELAAILSEWLTDGAEAPRPSGLPAETVADIERLIRAAGMTDHQVRTALAHRGVSSVDRLTPVQAQEIINKLEHVLSRKAFAEQLGGAPARPDEPGRDGERDEAATEQAAHDKPDGADDFTVSGDVSRPVRA